MEVKRPDTPRPPEEDMAPCPSCQSLTGYIRHVKPCNGCENMICTNCRYGARYFCPLAIPPPSLPISRQCSTDKWILAEEYLRSHPELTETIAEKVGHHVYLVRRTSTGEFVREHKTLAEK
jgi:hypothetical protein